MQIFSQKRTFFLIWVFCLPAFFLSAQVSLFPSRLIDYVPAPGQFVNTSFGSPFAAQSLIGGIQGGVSLGSFGGYIVFGFDHSIKNDPQNPYGIDFTILGNASINSSEPGAVWVMKDENKNGLPDDTWFLLAGSDYWFSSTIHQYEVTYFNPKTDLASDIHWEDNLGNVGVIPANEYHTQPYYPLEDSFPQISHESYILKGERIRARFDNSVSTYITSQSCPFGYADNHPRNIDFTGFEPDNPYTVELEGSGGDAFDISWAVDSLAQYVNLDQIDFIKIQNAVNQQAGWIGELSTEVLGVVDVAPADLTGKNEMIVAQPVENNQVVGKQLQLNAFYFINGRIQKDAGFSWLVDNLNLALIDGQGLFNAKAAGKVTVFVSLNSDESLKDSIQITIIPATGITNPNSGILKVYPNPAEDFLNVEPISGNYVFEVINMEGIRQNIDGQTSNTIHIAGLQPGIYFLKIRSDLGSQMVKFIKK